MTTIKKRLAFISLFIALALIPLAGCASQDQSNASSQAESSAAASASSEATSYDDAVDAHNPIAVTVEVDASYAKDAGVDISALKEIAGPKEYKLPEKATAYDALMDTGATIEGDPSYVTSIDGLSEGAVGQSSGWMYEVNGETAMVAANEYELNDGDNVRWFYSSWE